jgi:hypothetical protein
MRTSVESSPRRALQKMLRAADAAPPDRQMDLRAAVTRAAAAAGVSVEDLRAYAFGPREYAFNGLLGCVVQQRSRITGALVGLYQAEQAGMDAEAGRWSTVCEAHGSCVNHATLAAARAHLPDPTMWCEACRSTCES